MADNDTKPENSAAPVLLCTDGSDLALEALRAGLAVIDPSAPMTLVTVIAEPDYSLVTGTGFAGGTISVETLEQDMDLSRQHGREVLAETRAALGLEPLDELLREGDAGHQICSLAEELSARAIVLGSRGRGGLRRAVLGSVSDHVVRHAPCAVVVSTSTD